MNDAMLCGKVKTHRSIGDGKDGGVGVTIVVQWDACPRHHIRQRAIPRPCRHHCLAPPLQHTRMGGPVLHHPPYTFQWPGDLIVPWLTAFCACHVYLVSLVRLCLRCTSPWSSSSRSSWTLPTFNTSLRLPTSDLHSSTETLPCKCKLPSNHAIFHEKSVPPSSAL